MENKLLIEKKGQARTNFSGLGIEEMWFSKKIMISKSNILIIFIATESRLLGLCVVIIIENVLVIKPFSY